MPANLKAALIEFGTSHSECLYSQYLFLAKSGYDVSVIANSELDDKITELNSGCKHFISIQNGFFKNRKSFQAIRKYLLAEEIKKVIINTAGGVKVRDFLFRFFPGDMEFIGVIHDTDKLLGSFTQSLITKKIRKYFVLNDYIVNSFTGRSSFRVESFYPIFFPEYKLAGLDKKENEFWICIPGWVEFIRRDYVSLLKALETGKLNPNVRFILLGSGGHYNNNLAEIKDWIRKLNFSDSFITFDNFVPNDLYRSYLEKSDIILPLIHPSKEGFKQFKGLKISGSFNLAFAHKKPLLCDAEFEEYEDFRENSFFYSGSEMMNVINRLAEDRSLTKNKTLYKDPKWGFEFQRKKYIEFIEK